MQRSLRVGFGKESPEANWNCPRFPTFTPSLSSCPYPGLCTEIIGYLADAANLSIVPTVIQTEPDKVVWGTKQENGSWSGAFGLVYINAVDTVCLFAQKSVAREQDFLYTTIVYENPFVLISRVKTEAMPPNLWSPYEVLDLNVWMATLFGWIAITLTIAVIESTVTETAVFDNLAIVVWRTLRIQMLQSSYQDAFSFHMCGNFVSIVYSFLAIIVVANLYGSNTILTVMKTRIWETFTTLDEAAELIASGQLTMLNVTGSEFIPILQQRVHSASFKEALKINPPLRVATPDEALELLETGRYILGDFVDGAMLMLSRKKCNLFYFTDGMPQASAHLLFNKNSSFLLKQLDAAIAQSASFIARTQTKYLSFDSRPTFSSSAKTCREQVMVNPSEQPLDFPSTAGIFLLVVIGLTHAIIFFIIELLVNRYLISHHHIQSIFLTKVRRTHRVV